MRIASQFINMLPRHETPEHTEKYEGFYHLNGMQGDVEQTTLNYIIRDHDRDKFENRKKDAAFGKTKSMRNFEGTATLEMRDQYYITCARRLNLWCTSLMWLCCYGSSRREA